MGGRIEKNLHHRPPPSAHTDTGLCAPPHEGGVPRPPHRGGWYKHLIACLLPGGSGCALRGF